MNYEKMLPREARIDQRLNSLESLTKGLTGALQEFGNVLETHGPIKFPDNHQQNSLMPGTKSTPMLKFLDSEKHIRHWQFRVWEDAQEEIIAVVPCDSSSTFDMRPLWENTLNRAKVRILFTGEQPSVHAIPTAFHGNGEKIEIRSLSTRAPSFIMADRDVALAHEVWEPLGESGLLVRVPSLLKIIDLLFGQLWEQTNHAPGFDARATLTDHELNILRMLKEGATDESVARRIGVSQRTIRRKMSDIMRRLGAHSRFEAGTIAAKQGLL